MAKGGSIGFKRSSRARLAYNDSDKSDEDYQVNIDEFDELEDDYCSSLDEDESEDTLGEFEEKGVAKTKVNKSGKPAGRKGFQRRRKNRVLKPKKKKVVKRNKKRMSHKQEEDDFLDVSNGDEVGDPGNKNPRKKAKFSYREEKEEDEDDDEFTLDELDCEEAEEDLLFTRKNTMTRLRKQKKETTKVRRRKNNAKVLKRTKRKKPLKGQVLRRKARSQLCKEFRDDSTIVYRKRKKTTRRARRKSAIHSESDIMGSGSSRSSHHRYTMSEEEREQVIEASEFSGSLATVLRSSCSLKMSEKEILPTQRKSPGRKGKEKVDDLKIEAEEQICGICLSEEGKRTVHGTLDCCRHYFCFSCIMEWSKVESRCPLCKQRFSSISKAARSDGGRDLKTLVISVPARDQVYQPSEEELRGFLDLYENVLCTECQLGGDDALMLLCDLCDSPAHTYCVGLGYEVPEGNWYCEGCRPTALASSNAEVRNPSPGHGASNNLSVGSPPMSVQDTFDLNGFYIADTPLTPENGFSSSPRVHDFQAASPTSVSGAYTVFERRRIQHHINQLLNNRNRQPVRDTEVARVSGNSLLGWQVGRVRELTPQSVVVPERMVRQNIYPRGSTTSSLFRREASSPRFSSFSEHILHTQASTSMSHYFGTSSHNEFAEVGARHGSGLDHQQPHFHSNRSNVLNDVSTLSMQLRKVSRSSPEKEQVQSMVRSHLKSLSRDLELGYSTFKDVARSSTHTILAACGLEHRSSEVYPVHEPLMCNHSERTSMDRSLMRGQCRSCFDLFARNVVREILKPRLPLFSRE